MAVKGVAQQSSLYNMYGEAKNSIDGSLDSNYLYIQCSGTSEQDNPWWTVDLKEKFKVFTVAVTNRGDCCPERINGAQIRIGNSAEDGGTGNPMYVIFWFFTLYYVNCPRLDHCRLVCTKQKFKGLLVFD